ncbi:tyrosine kinase receptor Cad96Ca-like, partial [Anoplophora glabripennis]|uniref:tyrosine kinase receptor Cad96Ca-like n=1 Tax=Anoplophora glabripennis TaxID=217634 RepID=UPI000C79185E
MGRIICSVLLSFCWIFVEVYCQLSENTPPTLWLDRNWDIKENETVGTKIAQAHGDDAEGEPLVYGLEPIQFYGSKRPPEKLPFRIDNETGTVYLNESLKGRAGQNLHLYVTAFDGQLLAKTEVNVNILNESLRYNPSKSNRPPFSLGQNANIFKYPGVLPPKPPPLPPSLPDYTNNPPPEISNNPYIQRQHIFQQKTYPEQNTRKPEKKSDKNVATILKPVEIEKEVDNNLSEKTESTTNTQKPTTARPVNKDIESTNELLTVDQSVKSLPELTATVIPIASVFAVFLTVGVIAMVFRKKIYLGKPKDSKEDMRKESSGGIVLRESPGLNLQEWRGVRAFSNRYEPWQNDSNHTQLDNQESIEIKNIDQWEFPRHRLKFFNILGEGAFGQVWKCEAVDLD